MKLPINNNISKKGFTLVELLVVIAILATLGGLSFGPIMSHLRSADVTKATNVCIQLKAAIDAFENEYDSLPYTGTYPADDENVVTSGKEFLEVIIGNNTDINDKAIKFFTTDEAQGSKDGLVFTNGNVVSLLDKWGNPYTIRLDYSGDGIIDATKIGSGNAYKEQLHVENAIIASPTSDTMFNDVEDAKSW